MWRDPVRLGEGNDPVYRDLLGRPRAYYDDLRARGLAGEAFAAAIP